MCKTFFESNIGLTNLHLFPSIPKLCIQATTPWTLQLLFAQRIYINKFVSSNQNWCIRRRVTSAPKAFTNMTKRNLAKALLAKICSSFAYYVNNGRLDIAAWRNSFERWPLFLRVCRSLGRTIFYLTYSSSALMMSLNGWSFFRFGILLLVNHTLRTAGP